MSFVFEAATAGGALRIEVAQPAGDAVAAALALAGHEALIVALEAWLQQPLDPRPVLPGEAAAGAADADLLWAHCGAVRLGFAWPLLLNAASVPSASALPVEWPDLAFEIDVAEFSTDPQPVAAQRVDTQPVAAQLVDTQPVAAQPAGAVLLLPPAFEPTWRVLLHGVAAAVTTVTTTTTTTAPTTPPLWADAEWRGPGTALLLCGAPQPGRRRRAAWRVQLATRYQRPLPELLGWTTRAAADDAAMPLRISGAAHLIAAARPPRAGCIAPALGGAGLWIGG